MSKKVLITGPSGSGKTYLTAYFNKQGKNSVDADEVEGLSGWYYGDQKVEYPINADKEFLDNHSFLWDRSFLDNYLKQVDEIYFFGMSGNAFELSSLFDKLYFLKTSQETLAERLRHESRKNPMGKTDYQLKNALAWALKIEKKAQNLGFIMVDAGQSAEEIYKTITK